ncbi:MULTISPECIES: TetR/AcrR family transcriptional regulator [unclassified Halomonas]|uniref:TetR/AcrR family transcriptional regulator n=1 Tax=unclassified Halomonas TaxID=2609666 RepID=UPI00209FAAF5|nr:MULTISPECIES: TetR/AcrR family transcriptional regulator [unclassified Halomonas]MCP1314347.1 TetR/AcrR family transcriptional regulator [Halomonas sp. 707D7]MCP1326806.1 TetR/AcrR family transcriptional regulator [Halomonas sp. 707D4]
MARKKEISLERILDAADAIIMESGGRQFTLDAVAERAGISKGGLVYSFATKDDLVAAVLQREIDRVHQAVETRAGSDWAHPRKRLLAYLDEALTEDDRLIRRSAYLMTALLHSPEKSRPAREYYRAILSLLDGEDTAACEIRQAVLAMEGLFLLRGLGFADPSPAEWRSVLAHARATVASAITDGGNDQT